MPDIRVELRNKRKKRRKTQEEIAHLLGWCPSKVSKIENLKQEITYSEVQEFESALEAQCIMKFTIHDYEKPALVTR